MMGHYTYHGPKQNFWSHFRESRSHPSFLTSLILTQSDNLTNRAHVILVQTDHTSDQELRGKHGQFDWRVIKKN